MTDSVNTTHLESQLLHREVTSKCLNVEVHDAKLDLILLLEDQLMAIRADKSCRSVSFGDDPDILVFSADRRSFFVNDIDNRHYLIDTAGSAISIQIQCQIDGVRSANGSSIKTYGASWHRVTLQHNNQYRDFDWPFIIADCLHNIISMDLLSNFDLVWRTESASICLANGATICTVTTSHGSGVASVSTYPASSAVFSKNSQTSSRHTTLPDANKANTRTCSIQRRGCVTRC
ncbi:hypothetical protein Ciccas_003696 [Cichlidogyrus casuarinus]|uniref:Uncharacterized protein n=1 Tax=Cichlidogyrus casuarinus TaxID=1844966 RepID=A0ABD2QGZ3_9PLAT